MEERTPRGGVEMICVGTSPSPGPQYIPGKSTRGGVATI
jgi:hypothetical protein